jgi:hypothetical protein
VALKIIKLGMDTQQVVAPFEAERQALALMDHPNIAKVLEEPQSKPIRQFDGLRPGVSDAMAFNADSTRLVSFKRPVGSVWLASGSRDGTVKLWDLTPYTSDMSDP